MEFLLPNPRIYSDLYCVTHIVDPNLFYIAKKDAVKCGIINQNEAKVSKFMEDNRNIYRGNDKPNTGDCIAFYDHKSDKYIRCTLLGVREISNETCFILFATDYGFPFHTYSTVHMYRLPEVFASLSSPIKKVGLDIVPAVSSFDYGTYQHVNKPHHEWPQDTINRFIHYMDRSIIVGFEPITAMNHKEITFGKMIILKTNTGKTVDLAVRLCNKNVAIQFEDVDEFWRHYHKLPSANADIINDALKIAHHGFDKLPDFDKHFRTTAKRMKFIFKALERDEQSQFEKETALKVMTWLEQNEEHERVIPSDEEFNEDEELMELYFDHVEEKKKENQMPVKRQVEPRPVLPIKVTEPEPPKPLKREFKTNLTFIPGGYQIATYTQNQPRCVNEALEGPHGSGCFARKKEEMEGAAAISSDDDNDELEWP